MLLYGDSQVEFGQIIIKEEREEGREKKKKYA